MSASVSPPSAWNDFVRRALRWVEVAFVAVGCAAGGGRPAQEALAELTGPAVPRDCRGSDRRIEREAARGIAELEQLLDRQRHG
jgi:hypothetical protein